MTQLPSPPRNPSEHLRWAQQVLVMFSAPENRREVGAAQLRSAARRIIRHHSLKKQLDLFRDNPSGLTAFPG